MSADDRDDPARPDGTPPPEDGPGDPQDGPGERPGLRTAGELV